jgi:hypothetical protein
MVEKEQTVGEMRQRETESNIPGERSLLVVCIALGAAQGWINRYAMNQDGVSYLDVGDAYFRGDWAKAISGYWSPMYCWLMGFALRVVKPSIWWEFITVHVVNLIIYVGALFCFRFFLHSILRALRYEGIERADGWRPLPAGVLSGLAYGIFLWASLVLIDASDVTPDLLVAAFVFLIGGYLVELRYRESYVKFAVFGILCGAAYLSKAAMFPVGFGLLAILLFSARMSRRRVLGVMLAALLFFAVSSPFIAALSRQKGRLTFGDSGKLAYASMVSPNVPQKHWQGEPAEGGVPRHTTRQILENPRVFEFAEPIGGTYPPWYDPSYWDDGARGSFRLRSQVRVLVQSARNYTKMVTGELGLLAGIGIFLLWGGAPTRRAILSNWPLIVAAGLNLGLYSLVLVRSRYVGAFVVLLLVAILAGVRLPEDAGTAPIKYVAAAVMATILFSVVADLAETAYTTMTVYDHPNHKDQLKAAAGLQSMGLKAGDAVSVIGDGTTDYWARLGRFRIVAEVFSPEAGRLQVWSEPWERRKLAYEGLRHAGAKAVVVWDPPTGVDPGWKQIANTNYYAYWLANQGTNTP